MSTSKVQVYGVDSVNPNILRPLQVDTSGFVIVHLDAIGAAAVTELRNIILPITQSSDGSFGTDVVADFVGNAAYVGTLLAPAGNVTVRSEAFPTFNAQSLNFGATITITGAYSVTPAIEFWINQTRYQAVLTGAAVTTVGINDMPLLSAGVGMPVTANVSRGISLTPFARLSFLCTGAGSATIEPYIYLSG